MRERLTSRWIASLTRAGKRIAISDVVVPGLVLRSRQQASRRSPSGIGCRRYTIPGRSPRLTALNAWADHVEAVTTREDRMGSSGAETRLN
jgi:hypothetical protein